MKIYLAGPFGFSEAGRNFQENVLIPALSALGLTIIDPWKLINKCEIDALMALPAEKRIEAWRALNPRIGAQNVDAIRQCDAVVAILDGVDVDSGTASEVGFAFGVNKRVFGYRGDFRLSADNEALIVNLQVEHFIRASGGSIVRTLGELVLLLTDYRNIHAKSE